jgi:hypothetical protein
MVRMRCHIPEDSDLNPLNAELNPICHLLALLGGTIIVEVRRLRVKQLEHVTYLNTVTLNG